MPISQRHIAAFEEQAQVLATMDVGKMWDRLLGEFLAEWERLNRQGVTGEALERGMQAFMESLSDKPVEDLARTSSSVAYNQGRSASILTARDAGQVRYVVRSETLEVGVTCRECWNLDTAVFEVGTPEYYEFMPPAKCLGGDRCRGFYIAVSGRAA